MSHSETGQSHSVKIGYLSLQQVERFIIMMRDDINKTTHINLPIASALDEATLFSPTCPFIM